jgi:glycogen operon protein
MTTLRAGLPWPLGACIQPEGVNFAVWAPDASRLELCLFDPSGQFEEHRLELPRCSHGVWHGLLPQAAAGLVYGYRAHGPWDPARGHRFNPAKLLLDPYAREVVGRYGRNALDQPIALSLFHSEDADDPGWPDNRDNAGVALKARVVDALAPGAAAPPRPAHDPAQRVLYELHVKGATQRHTGVPALLRGRYAGLAHPAFIAHLQRLGVTTLSLLPVHARADEERLQRMGLANYWGYSSIAFLAPEPRYAVEPQQVREEFRAMVRGLHQAGIEVVLDVVFNHSAETDAQGPTLSLRGLANQRYYVPAPNDASSYANWSGCGNCLDFSEPRVIELTLTALRYWLQEMEVDGFRFDLAPVLGRGRDAASSFNPHGALFAAIQADPALRQALLIAEPWDLGPQGYQLGQFPPGWCEWNDRYRDTVRAFWLHDGRGPAVTRGDLARRFAASSDHFQHDWRRPSASINMVCAHDGYTLRDLVSYSQRHNQANGEDNRDGPSHNLSWNCGVEGPSAQPEVMQLRARLQRALLATLLLSVGTPMLLAGDEIGHSQHGNNNAYCQDNTLAWLDWPGADPALQTFVAHTLALRRATPALRAADWLGPLDSMALSGSDAEPHSSSAHTDACRAAWLDCDAQPLTPGDWQACGQGSLAIVLRQLDTGQTATAELGSAALLLINADAQPRDFRLPPLPPGWGWLPRLVSDNSLGLPPDPACWTTPQRLPARCLRVAVAAPTSPASPLAAGRRPEHH